VVGLHPQRKRAPLADNGLVKIRMVPVRIYVQVLVLHHPVSVAVGCRVAVNIFQVVQFQRGVFQGLADQDKYVGIFFYILLRFPVKIIPIARVTGGRIDRIAALRPDLKTVIRAGYVRKRIG